MSPHRESGSEVRLLTLYIRSTTTPGIMIVGETCVCVLFMIYVEFGMRHLCATFFD